MAISDTITSMYENVGEVYDTITNVTLPEHKNIENIPRTIRDSYLQIMNNGIDVIYDNWEKVTGSGESLSLTPTEEAKMGIIYKGNTYQDSTTGANLQKYTVRTYNGNGIVFTVDETGQATLTGTATSNIARLGYNLTASTPITLAAGTYTLKVVGKINAGINLNDTNITLDGNQEYQFTLSEETNNFSAALRITNGTTYNDNFYITLASGTTPTTERYTGGNPAPNPDYPQPIQVVSGDNTIKVEGKNLFDKNIEFTGQGNSTQMTKTILNTGIRLTYNYTSSSLSKFCVFSVMDLSNYVGSTIRFYSDIYSSSSNKGTFYIGLCNENGSNRSVKARWDATTPVTSFIVPTLTGEQKYLCLALYVNSDGTIETNDYVDFTNMILTIDNEDMTYQPYQSASYPIYLGVENLWNRDRLKTGFLPTSGAYPTTNSTYPDAKYLTFELSQGNSFIIANSSDSDSDIRVRYIDKTTKQVVGTVTTSTNNYYTSTVNLDSGFANGTVTAKQDIIIGIMILRPYHTSVTADVTYGTHLQYISDTPIELCKIGTYQDRIFKSTGKNKVVPFSYTRTHNGITFTYSTNGSINLNGTSTGTAFSIANEDVSIYTKLKAGTYTLSGGINDILLRFDNTTGTNIAYTTSSTQFTLNEDTDGYIQLRITSGKTFNNVIVYPMINEGSTALPYEPYGTGWYLNKQIGKVVLNGSEDNWTNDGGGAPFKLLIQDANIFVNQSTPPLCYIDNFKGVSYNTTWSDYDSLVTTSNSTNTNKERNLKFRYTDISSLTNFKTWLSTHNTIVYYVLASPTYTEIEGTLKEQLEAIKTSYENQTNISQENNDLPFILDVSALKKV